MHIIFGYDPHDTFDFLVKNIFTHLDFSVRVCPKKNRLTGKQPLPNDRFEI